MASGRRSTIVLGGLNVDIDDLLDNLSDTSDSDTSDNEDDGVDALQNDEEDEVVRARLREGFVDLLNYEHVNISEETNAADVEQGWLKDSPYTPPKGKNKYIFM